MRLVQLVAEKVGCDFVVVMVMTYLPRKYDIVVDNEDTRLLHASLRFLTRSLGVIFRTSDAIDKAVAPPALYSPGSYNLQLVLAIAKRSTDVLVSRYVIKLHETRP